ncbi:L-aspartate oxidase [Halalkalibacterium halodurans]|uniref:L-aspartate oxidase n=1 Tax=Halalkalibacterium halodurans (strain ATCC BAA-125 / DSM 18197 / FERM 7344 / JCM 9153 / C-125) TaxID=272558 RepID=NADB_HALH5|nr:L-aspartate oxidase [Halalkalibacterium halodurans]Q9KDJ5.1 RecName: Full=L-aspartate oxidase; Short=LASPO; AltName: Full=Quinolinate synthase B [Halalkalibacterium halodurans C-125]MED4122396.1 L-aspartate oxidase [Halalkalibacterium halodurans]MED4173526.1 L-aspartate oxidase [Halalkalibacterium halodurans]BAB04937.1 L-aspartate oxidase [Halalkalibacterium halodurans C-125]
MRCDGEVIIVGSGIAAMMSAYLLRKSFHVIMITKSDVFASNSFLAQGGIAAPIAEGDDWQAHTADTWKAGAAHGDETSIEMMTKHAVNMIELLDDLGVSFDREESGGYSLGLEGAHGTRRIVHVNGAETGKAVMRALWKAIKNEITLLDRTCVYRFIKNKDEIIGVETDQGSLFAPVTIVATGGCGQMYSVTSNGKEATGDGIALAYRSGAAISDVEFIQFHPTVYTGNEKEKGLLISEAVRGEGGQLITSAGERLQSLKSRDVVSREIFRQEREGHTVHLDLTGISDFERKFPALYKGFNKSDRRTLKPRVTPGAHFLNGGISVDAWGQTSLSRLYAVGEVACTGVHGANRLASNSLLEGLVFAHQAATHIQQTFQPLTAGLFVERDKAEPRSFKLPTREDLQKKMMRYVGIERHARSLWYMNNWFQPFLDTAHYNGPWPERDMFEQANMTLLASLITRSAAIRTESRGGHFRADYPNGLDKFQQLIIEWQNGAHMKRQRPTIKELSR